ncbi:MAG TPA: thymidine kinase [Candidatus Microsaccharimonas sp.]|nr:thymidine kinase [Candidatus Microsaccharimonas sp.]
MAKLYFRYSAMNSGKTTALIQAAHNYEERGMKVAILKPAVDSKGDDRIVSRLGVERAADATLATDDNVSQILEGIGAVDCILIDEAQFLSPLQVTELFWYAVDHNTPVIAYGLRTDFKTNGFPGATRLLELAHEISELKTICRCGKKAILNARRVNGQYVLEGEQVEIDDKAHVEYEALCAEDYKQLVLLPRQA